MTRAMNVLTPHFAVPMILGDDNDFAVVEQDTTPEVTQCVVAVVSTPLGSRAMRPGLGLEDSTHELMRAGRSVAMELVEAQLSTYEPRAQYHAFADGDALADFVDRVSVDVTGVKVDG